MHYLTRTLRSSATLVLVAILMTALSSCGDTSTQGDAASGISTLSVGMDLKNADRFYRTVYQGDTIYLDLSASLQWPVQVGDADLWVLGDSILSIGFESKGVHNVDQVMQGFVGSSRLYFGELGSTVEEVDEIPAQELQAWYCIVNGNMVEINERLLTYIVTVSSYTGGAHPYVASTPFSYDLTRGQVITLNNLFVPGSHDAVLAIVKKALARSLNVNVANLADAGIFVDQFTNPGQPYITDNVLMFHFNPYDIACYADGPFDVAVYPQEVAQFLTPEARQLLDVEE